MIEFTINIFQKENQMQDDQIMNFITVLKWLKDNDIDIYSTHNKGKSIVAERVIRTLKNKIYKHVTAVLNTMLILLKKNLNLKMVIMLEFQGIKTFLLEDMLQFCWKQFLLLAKLKKNCSMNLDYS